MAKSRTKNCAKFQHPELEIDYDPAWVLEADVQWLLRWLTAAVAQGSRFLDGQTCQIGLGLTKIRANEEGILSLLEPDFRQVPIVWIDSLNHTLAHLRSQKDVVESVLPAEDLNFPSILQSAIVCSRLGKAKGFVLARDAPSDENDSGWYFGCNDHDHDHNSLDELQKVSLFHAAIEAPQIVPYVALPEGILVQLEGNALEIFRAGKPLAFKKESFLDARRSAG